MEAARSGEINVLQCDHFGYTLPCVAYIKFNVTEQFKRQVQREAHRDGRSLAGYCREALSNAVEVSKQWKRVGPGSRSRVKQ